MMKTYILSILITVFATSLLAQKPKRDFPVKSKIVYDTLVVYDTIFVTDTIRLKRLSVIEKLPTNTPEVNNVKTQKILIINKNFAATISANRILLSDNNNNFFTTKKSDNMKRLSFFGVVLFAFQNMVVAQNNMSLSLGGGAYNLKATERIVVDNKNTTGDATTPLAGLFKIGVNGERNFFKDNMSVCASLNYHFLLRSDFPAYNNGGISVSPVGEDYKKNYHMFSIPLFVRWNSKLVKPFAGAEFYYKQTPKIALVNTNSTTETEYYRVPYHGASVLGGLDFDLSKRIQARFVYAHGVTTENKSQINGNQYQTKMKRFELSLMYNLNFKNNSPTE